MKFELQGNLSHNGTDYKKGDVVDGSSFDPDQLGHLVEDGLLVGAGETGTTEQILEVEEAPVSPDPLVQPPVASDTQEPSPPQTEVMPTPQEQPVEVTKPQPQEVTQAMIEEDLKAFENKSNVSSSEAADLQIS